MKWGLLKCFAFLLTSRLATLYLHVIIYYDLCNNNVDSLYKLGRFYPINVYTTGISTEMKLTSYIFNETMSQRFLYM